MRREDYIIEQFLENFAHISHENIALYGTGEVTKLLISASSLQLFNFVLIIDQKYKKDYFCGLPVVSISKAAQLVRHIVIVANLSVAPIIYQRIQNVTYKYGCIVWYLNGMKPDFYDESIALNAYWKKKSSTLLNFAKRFDVVSFDIFDTLLMRKCLTPNGVFSIMDNIIDKDKMLLGKRFSKERISAEIYCSQNISKYFTLDMIYRRLHKILQVSYQEICFFRDLEIELENKLSIPRQEVIDCMRELSKLRKTIVLSSDMYLSVNNIEELLRKHFIFEYDELLISSQCHANKYNGELYDLLKRKYPQKSILHIGDNYKVDVEQAQKHGIEVFEIKSAKTLFELSNIKGKISSCKKNAAQNLTEGLFVAGCFSNPFGLSNYQGRYLAENMYDVGYNFWGPVILYYMAWLADIIEKLNLDGLLFISRDAYLLQQLFFKIKPYILQDIKSIYFYSSRQASSVACIKSLKDVAFIMNHMLNVNTILFEDVLKNAFHINADNNDPLRGKTLRDIGKSELLNWLKCHYLKKIKKRAAWERENYVTYIKSLDLKNGMKLGFINFVGRGVSQKFTQDLFSQTLNCVLYGLYFSAEIDIWDIYPYPEKIFAAFSKNETSHTSRLNIIKYILMGESILTAPNGTLKWFDTDGKPCFDSGNNINFQIIADCHKGIEAYVADFLSIYGMPKIDELDKKLADDILGILFSKNVIRANNVNEAFQFSDPYGEKL